MINCIENNNESIFPNIENDVKIRDNIRLEVEGEILKVLEVLESKMVSLKLHQISLISNNQADLMLFESFLTYFNRLKDIYNELNDLKLKIPKNKNQMEKNVQDLLKLKNQLIEKEKDLIVKGAKIDIERKEINEEYFKVLKEEHELEKKEYQKEVFQNNQDIQKLKDELKDYPELLQQIYFCKNETFIVEWLQSLNLYQKIDWNDYKDIQVLTKNVLKCKIGNEMKVLKSMEIPKHKTDNILFSLLNYSYIIKPEICFIHENMLKVQFQFYFQSLKDWIKDKTISEKRLLLNKLFLAFNDIHSKNIIHRNINFDHILVDKDNPIIIGFGSAKKIVEGIEPKDITGTPYFKSPELEDSPVTKKSDVWSVGVILFDIFYGDDKFGSQIKDNIHFNSIEEDDDGLIINLLKKMLKYKPEDRPHFKDLLILFSQESKRYY